ncbi:MAG: hypothetical protein RLZ10_2542 [Bacteroidota bacterium]|jgi:hypothetical protein
MTIKEFFKDLIETTTVVDGLDNYTFKFIHGTKSWQNLIGDEITDYPNVFMDDPIKWKYLFTAGSVLEKEFSLRLMINFKRNLDLSVSSELENTPQKHQILVDLAVKSADKIVNRLRQNSLVKSVGANAFEFINFYDINLDGVFLDLTLVFRNSNSIC